MGSKDKYIYEWPRPMVTVDAIVFSLLRDKSNGIKVKLLLIKRGQEPFKDQWALPGGFVGIDEELEKAAKRELQEETNLKGVELEQMHTFGKVGRDPRGRQITIAYIGIVTKEQPDIKGGDDADEAKWFDINALPSKMAFDHSQIAEYAITELRRKKIYKDTFG
ncbi:MAG: NUDIX domain-containing protein [Planctomycetota bacterium]|jgi:8-oxo-dGTP diphosphatase